MNFKNCKSYTFLLLILSISLFLSFASESEVKFKIKGKIKKTEGVYSFAIKDDETFKLLVLPGEPRAICSSLSKEGEAQMKDLKGLGLGRWDISGTCFLHTDGKKHIVKTIDSIKPLGPGIVYDKETEVIGILEVIGQPNSENYLKGSSMIVHGPDGIDYRIPAKKFKEKPSGLSYQDAALLHNKKIVMKSRIQYYRAPPHRVATIHHFELSK